MCCNPWGHKELDTTEGLNCVNGVFQCGGGGCTYAKNKIASG